MKEPTWILTFIGDGGRAILTTTQKLEREAYEHVRELWAYWVKSNDELMVIGDCEIRRTGQVELEISSDAIIVRGRVA